MFNQASCFCRLEFSSIMEVTVGKSITQRECKGLIEFVVLINAFGLVSCWLIIGFFLLVSCYICILSHKKWGLCAWPSTFLRCPKEDSIFIVLIFCLKYVGYSVSSSAATQAMLFQEAMTQIWGYGKLKHQNNWEL
jgi:hypothetical protein